MASQAGEQLLTRRSCMPVHQLDSADQDDLAHPRSAVTAQRTRL
jgi:hypothetical protein